MNETLRVILEALFFPTAAAIIIWTVTQRRSDKATIKKTLEEASKARTENMIAQETVEAAIQLADIKTLQESISVMGGAFREERESLTRRLESAALVARTALERQNALAGEVDDLRSDIERYHREVLDLYRRDQYHARALQTLTDWINENLPGLLELRPEIPKPPVIDSLPPLHVHESEDVPNRRWYDAEPAIDAEEQEL